MIDPGSKEDCICRAWWDKAIHFIILLEFFFSANFFKAFMLLQHIHDSYLTIYIQVLQVKDKKILKIVENNHIMKIFSKTKDVRTCDYLRVLEYHRN